MHIGFNRAIFPRFRKQRSPFLYFLPNLQVLKELIRSKECLQYSVYFCKLTNGLFCASLCPMSSSPNGFSSSSSAFRLIEFER